MAKTIKANQLFKGRSSGVLLHVTSLPESNLGKCAYKFVDWLAEAGQTWWQMLPVGPVGKGGSPYSALSSFAGNPNLVCPKKKVDMRGFAEWREQNAWWLTAWSGKSKQKSIVQYTFAKQWEQLRKYANGKGIQLIGDVPIFVGAESIEVRANPELFRLNRNGNPTVVTGVPPDCYSADGQRWGHPHYNWAEHKKNNFSWWRSRIRLNLERFDVIRIDHFIGLHHAYEISARAKTARKGEWARTPGRSLLRSCYNEFGNLPFIAEDLGYLTAPVEKLRDDYCLPGVRISQQGIWDKNSRDYPMNHPKHSIAYSGTHDTDTIAGWWSGSCRGSDPRHDPIHEWLIGETMKSPACIVVIPMQDILGLGSEARMNIPGTPRGNWNWKLKPRQLTAKAAKWLRFLTEETKRV